MRKTLRKYSSNYLEMILLMSDYKVKKFSMYRAWIVGRRVLKQLTRDHKTFGMIIIMPIVVMLIFGIALAGEVKHVPIVIDNLDDGYIIPSPTQTIDFGTNITSELVHDDRVDVDVGAYIDNIGLVDKGEYFATIQIPHNFTASMITDGNATLLIYIDATKPQVRASIYGALQDAIGAIMGDKGIQMETINAFGNTEYSGLDVAIPAVMGYILTFLVLMISMLTAKRETLDGTEFRLFATPLSPIERIIGYVIALSIFAMITTVAILGIAIFVFGSVVKGSFLLLLTAALLYGLAHVFLALFLSNFADNELQAIQVAVLIALPSLALSGMLIPLTSLPEYLQTIGDGVPLTYGIRIFEGIMLKGYAFADLITEFAVIGVLCLVFFILALFTSKDHVSA